MKEPRGEELKLLVRLLRGLRGWEQGELAAAAGLDASTIGLYETGNSIPPRKTLERLVAAVGLPMSYVDGCLLPTLSTALRLAGPHPSPAFADLEDGWDELEQTLKDMARSTVAALVSRLDRPEPWERTGPPVAEDRRQAQDCWSRRASPDAPEKPGTN